MESHPTNSYSPQKIHRKRDSRPSSSLSVQSSSSKSSRESSASRSPCKQCQILKERMHDFYEESIASRSMIKGSDGDSSVSEGSPFATPTKNWKSSQKKRPKVSTPTQPTSILSTPPRTTSSLAMKSISISTDMNTQSPKKASVSTSTTLPQTPAKRTMIRENNSNISVLKPNSDALARKSPPKVSPENNLKPKQLCLEDTFLDRIYIPCLLLSTISVLCLFFLIQSVQPNVFIDEFFHVAQSEQYCLRNNFTHWDNKITTPPGLYLSSYLLLKPLQWLPKLVARSCSITQHRFTNMLFTFGNFLCLKSIFQNKGLSRLNSDLFALTFALFPPLFFPFSFLYYTDVGSLFTLLILLKFSKQNLLVIPLGMISLLFRQTNIVWIFYIASGNALQEFFILLEDVVHFSRHEFFCAGFRSSFFRPNERYFLNPKYSIHFLLHFGWRIVSQCYGYIFNALVFVAFLYLNEGIVLGDRSAHQASFHLAQIPYFLTFCGLFALPILFTFKNFNNFLSFGRKHPFCLISLLTFISICLSERFTFVHPYLLADNRHYTFYLWKKLWSRNQLFRYGPVPIYAFIAFTMYRYLHVHSVLKKQNSPFKFYEKFISKVLYILVMFVTIVPQQLIEFRYFIVPFIFWRLNVRESFTARELVYFIAINAITIAIFCMKTIKYSDSQPSERIIW